ncbi:MAG: hypothetical protein FJZ57_02465 [Chlamydiae bacterium]|nr:hypothetical protein [Chlamydiota bacterium]
MSVILNSISFNYKKNFLTPSQPFGYNFSQASSCNLENLPIDLAAKITQNNSSDSLSGLSGKTIVIIGCSYGSGHKQAMASTAEVVKKLGVKSILVDLPNEVLLEEDYARNLTRKYLGSFSPEWSTGDIFNFLMQRKAYSIINFISGNDPKANRHPIAAPLDPRKVLKVHSYLSQFHPDAVVINYLPDIPTVIEVSRMLNIPVIHTHTDMNPRELCYKISSGCYDRFTECLPYSGFESILTSTCLSPHQVVVSGPPCNSVFDTPLSSEEIEDKMKFYGISPDKKVIVISNGINGVSSTPPYIRFIHNRYKGQPKELIPFHLVVLCGKGNQTICDNIHKKWSELIPITALTSVEVAEMRDLMSIASQGGAMLGKPGGLTVFESLKLNVPLIFDSISPEIDYFNFSHTFWVLMNRGFQVLFGASEIVPWESDNRDFIVENGLGYTCESEEKFHEILDLLSQQGIKKSVPSLKFSDEFPKILKQCLLYD